MNLKVKNTIIPHGQPGILIPLDKARPIFQEVVGVNSIVGELDVDDPASNQQDSNQPLHHCSFGYQPSTT